MQRTLFPLANNYITSLGLEVLFGAAAFNSDLWNNDARELCWINQQDLSSMHALNSMVSIAPVHASSTLTKLVWVGFQRARRLTGSSAGCRCSGQSVMIAFFCVVADTGKSVIQLFSSDHKWHAPANWCPPLLLSQFSCRTRPGTLQWYPRI